MKWLKNGIPVLVLMATIIATIGGAASWIKSDLTGIRSDIRSFHERWDGINTAQNDLRVRVLKLEIEGEN